MEPLTIDNVEVGEVLTVEKPSSLFKKGDKVTVNVVVKDARTHNGAESGVIITKTTTFALTKFDYPYVWDISRFKRIAQ